MELLDTEIQILQEFHHGLFGGEVFFPQLVALLGLGFVAFS